MNLPRRLYPLLFAALTLPLSQLVFPGCATILNGPTQKVKFDSKPPGATVYLDGKDIGRTPKLVILSRFRSPRVRIELAGFQPYELQLVRQYNYRLVLNNMVGFAPILVDAATGSLFEIDLPANHGTELVGPWDKGDYGPYRTLFVGVVLKPVLNARKIGQLQRQ